MYEAIREVSAGREAWANVEGRRVRLVPVEAGFGASSVGLCRWNGRVVLAALHEKDTRDRVCMMRGATSRRTSWRDVLAIVAEVHPEPETSLEAELLGYAPSSGRPARIPRSGSARERTRTRPGRRRGAS